MKKTFTFWFKMKKNNKKKHNKQTKKQQKHPPPNLCSFLFDYEILKNRNEEKPMFEIQDKTVFEGSGSTLFAVPIISF